MDAPLQEPAPGSLLILLQENPDSQRAFRRFPLTLTISVAAQGDHPPVRNAAAKLPATLTNASMNGFCFSSIKELALDTVLLAEIEMDRRTYRIPAIVRRCDARKKLGRIFYDCGVQYVKSEDTLLFLPLMAKFCGTGLASSKQFCRFTLFSHLLGILTAEISLPRRSP